MFFRTLRTIEWNTRPKWIQEERLYSLACADMPPHKKAYILRAMASSDPADVKSLDIPQTGIVTNVTIFHGMTNSKTNVLLVNFEFHCLAAENVPFRDWLRIEVFWCQLEREAMEIYRSIRSIHLKPTSGADLDSFLDNAKQEHRNKSFSYEIGIMKKGPASDINKALSNASKRCLCR